MTAKPISVACCVVTLLVIPATTLAQHQDTLPVTAYAQAERFMQHKMGNKVYRDRLDIHWLDDGYRFWYGVSTAQGTEYNLVDPAKNTKQLLVDRIELAKGLSAVVDSTIEATRMTLGDFELAKDVQSIQFNLGAKRFSCELATYRCTSIPTKPPVDRAARRSPDGTWDAFIKDYDLYVRKVTCTNADGDECTVRLTTDGSVNQAYGRAGTFGSISAARTGTPQAPVLVWSPDSKKIAVMRWDQRGVESFYYISSTTIRPELWTAPQSIPGDSIVERYDIHIVDLDAKTNMRIRTEQIPWVRGGATGGGPGDAGFVSWAPTSDRVLFLSNDRGATRLALMTADTRTGEAKRLVSDSITFKSSAISEYVIGSRIWRLSRGNDVLWYSERDGGSHIYRYDATGKFINKVTEGPWNVMDVDKVDTARAIYYLRGKGRESNQFRAHTKLYRVKLDGSGLALLTPEPGEHSGNYSPDGRFFVDTYSLTDVPPVAVLRSTENGRVIRELERADISYATALGWKPPTVIELTAADGVTPIYAVMWKPTNFDSTKRYPVVNHIYPMPLGSHTNWGFSGPASETQAIAELGFIVVEIQPRGVRDPSRAIRDIFRTQYNGRYGEATLPDHVEALKQMGGRFPWFDISRIGLYGTSGGGFVTTAGMLRYPDFFKAGVAFAGNHDDRSEQIVVGESWRGLYRKDAAGRDNYEGDANYLLAGNLKGKLLLVHGDLDEAVHPSMSIRMAAALIDAGKRFDFMILPDQGHTSGGWFGTRLVFDYFVHNLMGLEPPQYMFTGTADPVTMRRRPAKGS